MELKYVVEGLGKVKTSCDSRRSFMKDLCRLKFDPLVKDIDEKYCIFISNMSAVLNNYTEKEKEKINDKFLLFFDKNLKKNSGKWFSTNWNLDNKKTREKCKYKPMILVIDVNNETQITKQQWAELLPMYKNQIDKK